MRLACCFLGCLRRSGGDARKAHGRAEKAPERRTLYASRTKLQRVDRLVSQSVWPLAARKKSRSLPVPAAAGGLEAQPVARLEMSLGLARQVRLAFVTAASQDVSPRLARLASARARRSLAAAIGEEVEVHRLQRLELTHDAVAASVAARSARAAPDRVPRD